MQLTESDLNSVGKLEAVSFRPIHRPKVVIDSRIVESGDIFVALKGEKRDGHEFIPSVLAKGAALSIVSEAWRQSTNEVCGNFLVVPDTLRAMQELARLYRRKAIIPIIAIGGNSGKTTTKEMMAHVLRSTFKTHATEGNLNNHIGVPLTLFGLTAETEIAVIEMGMNHEHEMTTLCSIAEPTHGLITNIGKAHIEFFESLDHLAKAEGELYQWIGQHNGSAFVNADDEWVLREALKVDQKLFYGLSQKENELDVYAKELGTNELGQPTFLLTSGEISEVISLKLSGRHNIQNALVSVAVGLNFGVPMDRIKAALESFEIEPQLKRMSVEMENGIVFINDSYNANPESMRAGLNALVSVKNKGKKIAVLGDMLELGSLSETEHVQLGKFISTLNLDMLLCFGRETLKTVSEARVHYKEHFQSKDAMVKSLVLRAESGDAILFKGSRGMKMETILEDLKKSLVDTA